MDGSAYIMLVIGAATDLEKPEVWKIIRSVIADGDTYVFDPDTPRTEMMAYWFSPDKHNYVAVLDGKVVGTFWSEATSPD